MGLSSNILWHQTTLNGLMAILKERTFRYSYSKEMVFNSVDTIAFPMISFCDLPLSEFSEYIGKYGGYSIGVSRSWGIKIGVNPVWYCDFYSNVVHSIMKLLLRELNSSDYGYVYELFEILAYIKPMEDKLKTKRVGYSKYRFSDERELRIVPYLRDLESKSVKPFLYNKLYEEYKVSNNNSSLIELGESFEWSDIKYVIVKNKTDVKRVRKLLKTFNCDNEDIGIFYQQQVKADFIGIEHNKVDMPTLSSTNLSHIQNLITQLQNINPINWQNNIINHENN